MERAYEKAAQMLMGNELNFAKILEAVEMVKEFGETEAFAKDGLWHTSTIWQGPNGGRIVFAFSHEGGYYRRAPWIEIQNQGTPKRYESTALVEWELVDGQPVYVGDERRPSLRPIVWINGVGTQFEV